MPQRPGTACRRLGGAGIIHNGVCPVAARAGWRRKLSTTNSVARLQRAAMVADGSDCARWYLQSYPVCVSRTAIATDVHHIIARRNGGGDSYDNLMALRYL